MPGVGAPERVDLRIVSATNEDTAAAIAAGRLRQDLLFRLEGLAVTLPPLRTRLDDIPILTIKFLQECAAAYGIRSPELSDPDLATLIAHDWPGNVRELRNVAERFVILSQQGGSMADAISGSDDTGAATPRPARGGCRF